MGSSLIRRLDNDLLKWLQKLGAKRSAIRSLEQAGVYFACFLVNSTAMWYGGIQVRQGAAVGDVMAALFSYIALLFSLANVTPHITCIADAIVLLKKLRQQLERQPHIDIRDHSGIELPETGWVPSYKLENVTMSYASRPTVPALKNVSVKVESGTLTAFVGPSGSGKSTIAALLLREYDPETANTLNASDDKIKDTMDDEEGQINKPDPKALQDTSDSEKAMWTAQEEPVRGTGKIYFADRDVRGYDLRWLRSQVAVVPQDPQLFTATVFENVAAGLTGTEFEYRPDIDGASNATPEMKDRTAKIRELCGEALRKAQAWQFVSKLPQGIDTMIAGGRTGILSGGQKQRIAIARALIRKPACILLDEATSALDAETEEKIRLMLEQEQAERGMTTIVIAHRLATIAKAHRIIVMKEGRVVDQGRYEDLVEKSRPDQTFRQLAMTQLHEVEAVGDDVPSSDPVLGEKSSTVAYSPTQSIASEIWSTTSDKLENNSGVVPLSLQENERRRSFRRFLTLIASQKWFFLTGAFGGLLAGGSFPVFQWMYGQALESLRDKEAHPSVNTWSMWLLILAIAELLVFL